MALTPKVANLISLYFNQCMSSTSLGAKKTKLKEVLDHLFTLGNDNEAYDYLNENLTDTDSDLSKAIDKKSGLGSFSSTASHTRSKLNELLNKINPIQLVHSRLSSQVYDNISLKIDECIGSTADENKKEELDTLKTMLLRQASDQEAIVILRDKLQNDMRFKSVIDKHTNSISALRDKQTNTRIQLQNLLDTISSLSPDNRNLHNWMDQLADDTPLRQITMPGSHDAGVYDDPNDLANRPITKGASAKSWGICHELSIYNQCRAGVRYLDIRIAEKDKGQWYALHAEMGQGVWGAKADRMLDDLARFITENPSEVLFYKVTHTHDLQYLQHAIRKLHPHLCTRNDAFQTQNITLAEVQLSRLRGTIVMLLENDEKIRQMNLQQNHPEIFDVTFPFSNLKGDNQRDTNPAPQYNAQRLYIFGGNTGKGSVRDMIHGQLNKAVAFKALPDNYLFQMSWTQMGTQKIGAGDIRTKAKTPLNGNRGGGPHSTLPFLCLTLRGRQGEVRHVDFISWNGNLRIGEDVYIRPNFIHMDFSCANNSGLIIALNTNWK
ncbi:hypothetical protein SAMN02949497_2034 [Methylomagnum ishizawai]|uniref:Phosphatidylinositol diacylglycerol-lyase n=1 Tax=Methylomagnum ishizawai TaxID=1760988 RepID=A0A1Y6D2B9_9GAMM|nr:hypothetical protein [Methylomagnum ishizawai]SMF94702.1 hypothetical protein SAMN02949497_2034 [Methylomagnum ishizawai]